MISENKDDGREKRGRGGVSCGLKQLLAEVRRKAFDVHHVGFPFTQAGRVTGQDFLSAHFRSSCYSSRTYSKCTSYINIWSSALWLFLPTSTLDIEQLCYLSDKVLLKWDVNMRATPNWPHHITYSNECHSYLGCWNKRGRMTPRNL